MPRPTEALPSRFVLGINYWPRHAGPRMWLRFDEAAMAAEFRHMRRIGIDAIRFFALAPDFAPRPPAVDQTMIARLVRVCELASEVGLALFFTPLVGHMSGVNFDFAGRPTNGRSSHWHDDQLLDWQVALVDALAKRAPGITAWVLSNELPLWLGMPSRDERPRVRAHVGRLVEAVRRHGAAPVGLGDGAMGGFPTAEMAPLVDFVGPHVYSADLDPARQAHAVELALLRARALAPDKPILLEEFGASATQAGEAEQAAYYRETILSAFAVGARGAFGWCWSDFLATTVGLEAPYSHHPFELGFGITRADGSDKPVCDDLRALSRLFATVEPAAPLRSRAALLIPRVCEEPDEIPFSWQEQGVAQRTLLAAYTAACRAGLYPELVVEPAAESAAAIEPLLRRFDLILCPATQKLRTATWLALEHAAARGATVYWSYFGGDHAFHQGAWCPNFSSLTGTIHRLRYGTFALPPAQLQWSGAVSLQLSTAPGAYDQEYARAGFPVEVTSTAARAVAHDGSGAPALIEHALGSGRVVFATHPVERYQALTAGSPALDPLYAWLAGGAPAHDADIQVRRVAVGDGEIVLAQNRGWRDLPLADLSDGELLYAHDGPKGARVWRRR